MPELSAISDLNALRERLVNERKAVQATITMCGGTGCQASRSLEVVDSVKEELAKQGLEDSVHVRVTGCHGFCEQGPIAVLEPGNIFYCRLQPEDAGEIVSSIIRDGEVIERLLYTDPVSGK
ncbi:MAG: (2Fe-2S) ferredoxin domain-containing protein, partial [Deltaproteobacteria bacterium]|nr:(2Fe-2S) ferredoxin domain-containing protein [Deltaproteobacteria bacterium]